MPYYLLTTLVLFLSGSAWGQNLVANSGFEDKDLSPWSIYFEGVKYTGAATWSKTEKQAGNQAMYFYVDKVEQLADSNKYDDWESRVVQIALAQNLNTLVQEGDILTLRFWAKGTGSARTIQAGITQTNTPYKAYDMSNFNITPFWQRYEMQLIATETTADLRLAFNLGRNVGNYYLDDISLEKTGEVDKLWYDKAEERINNLRKGNFRLLVQDAAGKAVNGAQVAVKLKKHAFEWGTALTFFKPLVTTDANEIWYRETAAEFFNTGVFENDFKWPQMEPSNGKVNYSSVDTYLEWAQAHDWQMRGHTIVWGIQRYLPSWVNALSPSKAAEAFERRIKRDIGHYKGIIHDYDVINEPCNKYQFAEKVGDSIYVSAYKWAQQTDPMAKLYINDYWNIDKFDTYRYRAIIDDIRSKGGPIGGIGLQSHLERERVNWKAYKMKMDYLAETGLPLKITEFDMFESQIKMSEQELADDYAKMMRLAFSHPSVEGFLFWGFWAGRRFRPDGALFNRDKSRRLVADSVYNLIHKHWTTQTSAPTAANGEAQFRGFFGKYEITVSQKGLVDTFLVNYNSKADTLATVKLSSLVSGLAKAKRADFKLKLNPNPATDQSVAVIKSTMGGKASIRVYDPIGRLAWAQVVDLLSGNNAFDIPLQNLAWGLYHVQVFKDGQTQTAKLVKQ